MKTKNLCTSLAALTAACITTATVQAQLIVYEGFDYATTSDALWTNSPPNAGETPLDGGTGFAPGSVWAVPTGDPADITSGTPNFNVTSPGMIWGTLPVEGHKLYRTLSGGTEHLAREVTADLDAASEMWFGVLWTGGDNAGFVIGGGPFASDTSTSLADGPGFGFVNRNLAVTGRGVSAAVWDNAGNPTFNADGDFALARGETVFLVGRVQFNESGSDDVLTLYNVGTNLTLPAPFATLTVTSGAEANLDTIAMNSNRSPGVDEIRVAASFADLISELPLPPESSLALSPSASLEIPLYAPASTATGVVSASFTYGSASNNVDLLSIAFTNESDPGAFSSLTSLPLTLTNPAPAGETLSIQFDNTVAGLFANFDTSLANLVLSWKEVGGSVTNTETVALTAVYRILPSIDPTNLPNVVFFMADDLGWSCINAYREHQANVMGHDLTNLGGTNAIPTPNLDSLVRDGMLFTDAHTPTALCSPTRFAVMTGSHPHRNGRRRGTWNSINTCAFTYNSDNWQDPSKNVRSQHVTVAEVMRNAGYRTAFFGKEHFGNTPQNNSGQPASSWGQVDYSRPFFNNLTEFGFDYYYGLPNGIQGKPYAFFEDGQFTPIDPSNPANNSTMISLLKGYHPGPNAGGGYFEIGYIESSGGTVDPVDPDWDTSQANIRLLNKAEDFIADHVANHPGLPFLLHFVPPITHTPHTPPIDYRPDTNGLPHNPPLEPVYGMSGGGKSADVVVELDVQIGLLMDALRDPNGDGNFSDSVLSNTLIIATSDNGGLDTDVYLGPIGSGDHQFPDPLPQSWVDAGGRDPDAGWGITNYDSTGVLNGFKREIMEGGHRVPFIVKWGDGVHDGAAGTHAGSMIEPGSVCDQLVAVQDWVASMYALTGQSIPQDQAMDSLNILPLLLGEIPITTKVRDFLLLQSSPGDEIPDYGLRQGDYVLHINSIFSDDYDDPLDENLENIALYNLATDFTQTNNLLAGTPAPEDTARAAGMLDLFRQHNEALEPRTTPAPGNPVVISEFELESVTQTVSMGWTAEPNGRYSIVATPDPADWTIEPGGATVLTNIVTAGGDVLVDVPGPTPAATALFFRLVRQE